MNNHDWLQFINNEASPVYNLTLVPGLSAINDGTHSCSSVLAQPGAGCVFLRELGSQQYTCSSVPVDIPVHGIHWNTKDTKYMTMIYIYIYISTYTYTYAYTYVYIYVYTHGANACYMVHGR